MNLARERVGCIGIRAGNMDHMNYDRDFQNIGIGKIEEIKIGLYKNNKQVLTRIEKKT